LLIVKFIKLTIKIYLITSILVTVDRYAMKCLDKKRIKLKGGETLALNERIMLSLVSTEVNLYPHCNVASTGSHA